MNYTLHQLHIFTEVVRLKSITKAANHLHLTQPALSIQLKNFQSQFDIPLTEIIGKQIYITDFGYSISEIALNILKEAEQLKFKTNQFKGLLTGRLRISSSSTGKYVVPYFLEGFISNNPKIELILDVSNKDRVLSDLHQNLIDFAVVSMLPDNPKLEIFELLENQLFLFNKNNEIKENQSLIFREKGSATGSVISDYFKQEVEVKTLTLTSNEAVKQAVIAGLGYSILPLVSVKNELENKQLYIVEQKGLPFKTKWKLIWLKEKKLSPVAKAFLEYLEKQKVDILKKHFNWLEDLKNSF